VTENIDGAEQEARMRRVEQNEDALRNALAIVMDLTAFTVGPGEVEEYEHVDLDRRFVEMSIFYYWLITNVLFDAIDYEWKTDYADAIAYNLARHYPGVQAVLTARWLEYEGDDPSAPLGLKARVAAERVLYYIDPETPVPQEFARDLAIEGPRVAAEMFREHTTWR
jgi:hypothetical protein